MKLSQVAVQLYTLRDHLKTPQDIAKSLKKVRKIGFTAVQESGLGPIEVREWLSMLKGEGLTLSSTHEDSNLILKDPHAAVARLQERGVKLTAYPYPSMPFSSFDEVKALAKALDKSGAVFAKAGCVLTYHNHHVEFQHVKGKAVLEWIYELTDPAHLQGEPDMHWVAAGGADPVAWCKKLKGRMPMIHMKDFIINAKNERNFAPIGHGNMDYEAIVPAAEKAGCKWFIVEQDDCYGDPFAALKKSFDYVKANLV